MKDINVGVFSSNFPLGDSNPGNSSEEVAILGRLLTVKLFYE